MTNEEIIAKIKEHQECGFVHPLTCGNDSRHEVLVGVVVDGKVVLKCPSCDYVQKWVPGHALDVDLKAMDPFRDIRKAKP